MKTKRYHDNELNEQVFELKVVLSVDTTIPAGIEQLEGWIKDQRLKKENLHQGSAVQSKASFNLKEVETVVYSEVNPQISALCITSEYCRRKRKWRFFHSFCGQGFYGHLHHCEDSWTGRLYVEAGSCPEQSQQRLKEALAVLNLKVERFDLIYAQLTLGLISNRKENDHAGR